MSRKTPVNSTLREGHSIASETRKETQYNNQCLGLWLARRFLDSISTGQPRIRNRRDIDHYTSGSQIWLIETGEDLLATPPSTPQCRTA